MRRIDRESLLRPKWILFHLLAVVLVFVMVNLAIWQFHRMHQRQQFNATVRARTDQPVAALATVLTPDANVDAVDWRHVTVAGDYLPGVVEVVNLSQGGVGGRDVVSALRTESGRVVLVNRGFVPSDDPLPPAPIGTVRLVGQLRRSQVRGLGQPSDPSGVVLREVSRIEIPELAPQFGGDVAPMYLQLTTSSPAEVAIPVDPPVLEDGPHLAYAIQWILFSGGVVIGWFILVRGRRHGRAQDTPPTTADDRHPPDRRRWHDGTLRD